MPWPSSVKKPTLKNVMEHPTVISLLAATFGWMTHEYDEAFRTLQRQLKLPPEKFDKDGRSYLARWDFENGSSKQIRLKTIEALYKSLGYVKTSNSLLLLDQKKAKNLNHLANKIAVSAPRRPPAPTIKKDVKKLKDDFKEPAVIPKSGKGIKSKSLPPGKRR